jgi:hypothetical protein
MNLKKAHEPFHLCSFESDSALSFRTGLEELDRDVLAMNHEEITACQSQPRVHCRPGNSQTSGSFGRRQQFVWHVRSRDKETLRQPLG